jgi:hypothetical protein
MQINVNPSPDDDNLNLRAQAHNVEQPEVSFNGFNNYKF